MLKTVEFGNSINNELSLALGFFDGVHLGHRTLIDRVRLYSVQHDLTPAVSTFSDMATRKEIIYDYHERRKIFEELGMSVCISLSFLKIHKLNGKEFFDELTSIYNIRHIVCGENYTFGSDRCDVKVLAELCAENEIKLEVLPLLDVDCIRASSSNIRNLLKNGNISLANKLLGEPYHVRGEVVHGDGRGKNLGIPTANLEPSLTAMKIRNGVYGTRVIIDGNTYKSVTNYGPRPTFLQSKFAIETNVPNEKLHTLTGQNIKVYFYKYLRGVNKFANEKLLLNAIKKDLEWINED